ncbi:MAG: hypothetical protein HZB91_04830 [Elusimicrobia bacterium]|nr:hypothetical protein [Elusimicrobiota bacterium]
MNASDRSFSIPVSAVKPDAGALLHAQGVTGRARPAAAEAAAIHLLVRLAAPSAVVREVSPKKFLKVFAGEGFNETPNPLEAVFSGAERLALFAVTLGQPVCDEIDRLFSVNDSTLGCLLDTAASLAADRAAAWVETERHRAWAKEGLRSLRYSPGYCGWHLSGQKKLLAHLRPGRIGLSLSETLLMTPVKSISGVVAAAPPSLHAFEPGFAFCAACKPKSCCSRKKEGPSLIMTGIPRRAATR